MWKTLSDWLFALFNMSRELQEHRETIRQLEERLRSTEEAIKLLAQEQRHARELEAAEREKLLPRLQNEVAKLKELPARRGRKTGSVMGMALTRKYKTTIVARIQRDKKFARALYAEALNALLEGETEEGLPMLRDLVHAEISFKELAQQTGLGEKALHRMLNRRGNPTTRNLFAVTKAICEGLSFKPSVAVGANS